MNKTLLITGGLGFIGSHTVVLFEQAGYKTVIVDSLINSNKSVLLGIEEILGYIPPFYETDISDTRKLESIFEKYQFDGVIHFAGLKAVGESCHNPFLYHENNIIGSIHLFKTMEKYQVRNIVFSSSATVYSPLNTPPFNESALLGTTNPYGTTKVVLEHILEDYTKFLSWKCISLRYFNPIGAHPSGMIGENPQGIPNNIFPYIMKVASREFDEIIIFGDDYDTKDGTGARDYIDINDLAQAHLVSYNALELREDSLYKAINIGTGQSVTVKELIVMTEQVLGKQIPNRVGPRREGDISSAFADVTLASEFLSWNAKIPLEESIQNGWKFIVRSIKKD